MAFSSKTSFQSPTALPLFHAFAFVIFLLLPSAELLSFQITRFNKTNVLYEGDGGVFSGISPSPGEKKKTDVLYEGDAKPLNGEIHLNQVDYVHLVGRATYSEHVRI